MKRYIMKFYFLRALYLKLMANVQVFMGMKLSAIICKAGPKIMFYENGIEQLVNMKLSQKMTRNIYLWNGKAEIGVGVNLIQIIMYLLGSNY